jgi:hypothetical protein
MQLQVGITGLTSGILTAAALRMSEIALDYGNEEMLMHMLV